MRNDSYQVMCVECGTQFDSEEGIMINNSTVLCPSCGRANFVDNFTPDGYSVEDTEEDVMIEPYIEGYLSWDLEEDKGSDYKALEGLVTSGKLRKLIVKEQRELDLELSNRLRSESGYYEERARYKKRKPTKKRLKDYFKETDDPVTF